MAIEASRAVADSPAQWARPEAPRSIFCAGMAAGGFPLRSRSGRSVGADLSAGMTSRCGGETALWEQFKAHRVENVQQQVRSQKNRCVSWPTARTELIRFPASIRWPVRNVTSSAFPLSRVSSLPCSDSGNHWKHHVVCAGPEPQVPSAFALQARRS